MPIGRNSRGGSAGKRSHIEHRALISAQPREVYDLVADPTKRVGWLPELDATSAPARPLVTGDRFNGVSSIFGHRFLGASEVLAAEPDTRLEERVVVGAAMRTAWSFRDDGDGRTLVTHVMEVEFPAGPLGGLTRWLFRRRLARMQRAGLRRLSDMAGAAPESDDASEKPRPGTGLAEQ